MRPFIGTLKASLVGIMASVALSGCAQVQQMLVDLDSLSSPLYLSLGPPPPPGISQIRVTNGAGKTVMESDKTIRVSGLGADPDLADLDGTLTITATWEDGQVTTQTLTHEPNMPVALKYYGSGHSFAVSEDIAETAPATSDEPESRAGGD